jgi:D-3-phosphoglycerate dehydrogenase
VAQGKVLITSPIEEKAIRMIHDSSIETIILSEPPTSEKELLPYVKDVDGILVVRGTEPITRRIIEKAQKLKIIARGGVGYNNIDVDAATEYGVWVTIAPVEELFDSVAEYAIGLMLCLARKICKADIYVKKRLWTSNTHKALEPLKGFTLSGKVLGIIGLGNIGSRIFRKARAFNMKIIYYDVVRKKEFESEGAEYRPLKELLAESDFIILTVPLTKETYKMIGENEINFMKRTAYLINISRGAVIDHIALVKALKEGKIAGAALDVFHEEPLPTDDPILELDNVILTPHIAAFTEEAREKLSITAAEEVIRVLKGEKPRYPINNPQKRDNR